MSAAYATNSGQVVQLDAKSSPEEVLTPEDAADPEKLSKLLMRALKDIADLKRRWNPRVMYFRDIAVTATATTKVNFEHGFAGRVNWAVYKWDANVAGTPASVEEDPSTDANTLVLVSGAAGIITLRVEESG